MRLSKYFSMNSYLLDALIHKFLFTGIYSSYEICYRWIASMDKRFRIYALYTLTDFSYVVYFKQFYEYYSDISYIYFLFYFILNIKFIYSENNL